MSDIRDDVTAGFVRAFGAQPAGLWSAPGRVNLIGEHTDYNDGFVLPFAIDRRTVVALAPREDGLARVASSFGGEIAETDLRTLAPGAVTGWSAYVFGVAWALSRHGADLGRVPGFDAYLDSTVPVGAGLSSSAALESAVGVALDDVWGLGLDPAAIARVGQVAENEVVGAPTGILDQSASMLARRDALVFLDCRSLQTQTIDAGFAAAGLEVLVVDTRVEHAHADGGYRARRESCERGAAALGVPALRDLGLHDLPRARRLLDEETFRRVRHVVTENARVLETVATLRAAGPLAIGPLLDASHASMRDDFEISVPELDLAVETARENGAIGARMTGGGFGGSAIALAPSEAIDRIRAAVAGAFAEHGLGQPGMFTVVPSEGARRDR
ncbi:MAG: galactokinase [Microbacteriaceae bacterium]